MGPTPSDFHVGIPPPSNFGMVAELGLLRLLEAAVPANIEASRGRAKGGNLSR
jgi:hypothetical protein